MHLGFDAKRLFHNFTGLGNYSRTLIANLKLHYPENRITLFSPKGKITPRTEPFFDSDLYTIVHGGGAAWRTWSIYKEINSSGASIYHGLSHQIPFSSEKLTCKTVVTVHDLIHKIRPKDFARIDRLIYERKCKYACHNADAVIAVSEHTKRDIVQYYKLDPERIDVVYQSCDSQFLEPVNTEDIAELRELFSLPSEYLLYVGSVIPRKNLLKVVEALNAIRQSDRIPLLVIGGGRKYMGQVVRFVQNKKLDQWVHFLGDIPFRLFPAIYREAKALVYPSLYEGFGIPVIEALSVGTPVITSNTTSLPEAGGAYATYIDPKSVAEIQSALMQAIEAAPSTEDEREGRREFARLFRSDKTAGKLMKIYRRIS